jgi:uncharacterized protein HtrL/YibB-like
MNVTYVSGLYDIYSVKRFKETLAVNVKHLLNSGLNVILFVDEFFNFILQQYDIKDNIKIVLKPLSTIKIYNKIVDSDAILPTTDNLEKDTLNYMALINSKIELVNDAINMNMIGTEYVAWIDAGISKVLHDRAGTFKFLSEVSVPKSVETILIPGCYESTMTLQRLISGICWTFCGGFFLGNKEVVKNFHDLCEKTIDKFLDIDHIAWEVNIWTDIFTVHPGVITWYNGNHADDMFTNLKQFL